MCLLAYCTPGKRAHFWDNTLTQGQATKEHPMMGRSCRELPGGFCLGMVTAPESQSHLKRSHARPLSPSLHPGTVHWHKGRRGSCRSRGQDSHQGHSVLLKPTCSGCVTEGMTFPQGRFIWILQGSLPVVCNVTQLQQHRAQALAQAGGRVQQRVFSAQGRAQQAGPRSRRQTQMPQLQGKQVVLHPQSARHRGAPPHPAQLART